MNRYIFEKRFSDSYNTNLLVHEEDNPNSKWVAKISKLLSPVDFRDLDNRALLAYRLASLVNIRTVEPKVVSLDQITGFDSQKAPDKINNSAFLTRYVGPDLREFLNLGGKSIEVIKNKEEILRSFVFNLWIGNYDKKTNDYLIDKNDEILSIDYQLNGPGFVSNSRLAIGAYAEAYDFNDPADTGWCLEGSLNNEIGPLLSYVQSKQFSLKDFLPTIEKIKSVLRLQIEKSFDGLIFYNQGTKQQINNVYKSFLFERRSGLENVIIAWINEGFPVSKRPKNNNVL